MRKKLLKFLALSLAFVLCVPTAGAARRGEEMVRVGLAYGSGALVGANLENNTGYGSATASATLTRTCGSRSWGRPTRKRPRSPC